jgi:hypothetical protein
MVSLGSTDKKYQLTLLTAKAAVDAQKQIAELTSEIALKHGELLAKDVKKTAAVVSATAKRGQYNAALANTHVIASTEADNENLRRGAELADAEVVNFESAINLIRGDIADAELLKQSAKATLTAAQQAAVTDGATLKYGGNEITMNGLTNEVVIKNERGASIKLEANGSIDVNGQVTVLP